jgi:hypothetical protein
LNAAISSRPGAAVPSHPNPSAAALTVREEVVESLVVDMDLDVVAQGRGGVVKSRFDFAELRAQVLRQTSLVERASQVGTSVAGTT